MDTNNYEYISYTAIRKRLKDRGTLRVAIDRKAGETSLSITVACRVKHKFKKHIACVYGRPFSLPAPATAQNNNETMTAELAPLRRDGKPR